MIKRASLVTLVTAALSALTASAAQAVDWVPATRLGGPQSADTPSAAFSPSGAGIMAWRQSDGANNRIAVSYKPVGQPFRPAVLISVAGANAQNPSVAIDPSGRAVVVWSRASVIQISATDDTGISYSSPQTISDAAVASDDPDVVMSPSGASTIAWIRGGQVQTVDRTAAGTLVTVPQTFAPTGVPVNPAVNASPAPSVDAVTNARGDTALVWVTGQTMQAVYRPPGGTFGAVQSVNADTHTALYPSAALDGAGNLTVVWETFSPGRVYATVRPAGVGQIFDPAFNLDQDSTFLPQVAAAPDGTVLAMWIRSEGAPNVVEYRTKPLNRAWGPVQPVSAPGRTASYPVVGFDAHGNAVAAWNRDTGTSGYQVQATTKPPGQDFGAVKNLSPGGGVYSHLTSISVDDAGNALLAWSRNSGGNIVEAGGLDAEPPRLTSVSIPGAAFTGAGVGFSAQATDVWGPISYGWDFGDGTTDAGPSVVHAYGALGVFTVRATATDSAGNSSSMTGLLQAANPPVVVPAAKPPVGRITITLGFAFSSSTKKQTKFTSMTVKGFPSGSTITVTCIKGTCPSSLVTKKKVKKKTKLVSKPLVYRNARGTVKLSKVIKKALRAGTRIRVDVTKTGMIGATKILTVGKRKAPKVTTQCLPVGSSKPRNSCS
jgi:hypothetical protein